MEQDRRTLSRATSFGGVAAEYERYRPGYPAGAASLFGDLTDQHVVDVGAGTGLLTRFLVGLGATVTAVEIDAEMCAVLRDVVPQARVFHGSAEALPLSDASADVVVCSSAWHWFSQPEAMVEFARVVRPGGAVMALWNGFDEECEWLETIRQLREPASSPDFKKRHRHAEFSVESFEQQEDVKVPWTWRRTVDDVVELFGTYSGIITQGDEDRARTLRSVRSALTPHAIEGWLDLPMAVRGTRATRRR